MFAFDKTLLWHVALLDQPVALKRCIGQIQLMISNLPGKNRTISFSNRVKKKKAKLLEKCFATSAGQSRRLGGSLVWLACTSGGKTIVLETKLGSESFFHWHDYDDQF